jgi:hypothetical protein
MTSSELFSALKWLKVEPSVNMVHALVTRLDTDADGLLSCDDFVAGFAAGDPTADVSALSTVAPGQQELVIELHRIPELFTASAGGAAGGSRGPVVSLAQKELELFVAQIKPATSTQAVYKQPARADAAASLHVLQPALPASAKGATMLVPVGHFAQTEVESAAGGSVLELRDTKSAGFFSSGDASVSARERRFTGLGSGRGSI